MASNALARYYYRHLSGAALTAATAAVDNADSRFAFPSVCHLFSCIGTPVE